MATQLLCPTLSRSKFKNWIKSGLCVLFTKKGIEPFVNEEIEQFQEKCLSDICNNNGLAAGTTCSSCCTENVVVCPTNRICNAGRGKCSFHRNSATQYLPSGCPNKICHNFKSEIQNAHRFFHPSYKNTDATKWCSNPWEVAKCFMPPDSNKDVTSAAGTDFNGISSVIINHKAFHSKVHDDLGKQNNIFDKAREACKSVRQSSYFGVEDGDLLYYFSTFQRLLSDSGYLATNSASQNAREKLSQLQSDTLVLGIEDIQKVLDDFGKAGEDKLKAENHEHAKEAVEKLELIIKIIESCVSAFERQGKLSMSDLDKAIDSAINEIEIKTNKSNVKMQSGTVSELGFTANRHEAVIYSRVNRVQESKKLKLMTEEDINGKGKEDVQKMEKEVDNGEKRISLETDNTKRKMKEETGIEVKRLKIDVRAGVQPFETDSDMTKIASKSNNAVKQIEDIGDEKAIDIRTETNSRMENSAQVTKDIAIQTEVDDAEIADVEVETISSKSDEVISKKLETLAVANEEEKNRTDLPSNSDLAKIVKAIGINWELLGPHLDLLTAEIDHIKMDIDTTEKRIYKMLHVWRQGQGLNGTKQKLFTAFSNEPSTYIDWEALEQSFPDASKYKPREKNKHPRSQTTQDYEERKTQLMDDLVDLYRERHHILPLSPLLEENDTSFLKFYVMPDINSVEIPRSLGGGNEVRSTITSLHDVVYKENEPCREIYLTADAGLGKTALSKRLVLTWCQAKKCIPNEDKYFTEEEISTMSNFDFVFMLSLRDCSEEKDIDEMIKKQIIPDLAHTISTSDFENILSKERCLIILDGLDEFTHAKSDIPHRKARRKCTILTTTRPWKLGVSKKRSSEIERKLELIGLSKKSSNKLKRTVISLLCGKTDLERHIQDFDRVVSDRGISDLETVPLLLMYLLCLWCDGIELGASRTELYCQTVELLLKRTFEKYPDTQQSREQSQSDIPQCFCEYEHFQEHYTFLQALGQLAFETLFSETKESTLVFSQSMTDKHLTTEYLKLSLHSGILTQNTEKTLLKKFSFVHKSIQEFFCALYISCQNESDVKNIVLNKCKCLQSILDMSTVLVFISGMVNAEIISSISLEFLSVISKDKRTSKYRSTTDGDCEPLKDIQDMYISCMKENTSDKELKLFCQDFFFSEDCEDEKYFSYLALLAVQNKNNMASIHIDTDMYRSRSLREIIDYCELHELFQINKIYYWGDDYQYQLPVLLDKSSKCVTVKSPGSWSREILETLQNNSLLQAIYIAGFKMSHDILNDFLNYIINRNTMTEIRLEYLWCTEHDKSCTFSLDFSQHSELRRLELYAIPKVSQLKVNSQVEHVVLGFINLGEMSLPPEMANIKSVDLERVNMSASTLRDLVKVVEKLSHRVTVTIDWWCKIEPETEFEHVKQYIHSSQNFRVIPEDMWGEDMRGAFVFETKDES